MQSILITTLSSGRAGRTRRGSYLIMGVRVFVSRPFERFCKHKSHKPTIQIRQFTCTLRKESLRKRLTLLLDSYCTMRAARFVGWRLMRCSQRFCLCLKSVFCSDCNRSRTHEVSLSRTYSRLPRALRRLRCCHCYNWLCRHQIQAGPAWISLHLSCSTLVSESDSSCCVNNFYCVSIPHRMLWCFPNVYRCKISCRKNSKDVYAPIKMGATTDQHQGYFKPRTKHAPFIGNPCRQPNVPLPLTMFLVLGVTDISHRCIPCRYFCIRDNLLSPSSRSESSEKSPTTSSSSGATGGS